MLFSFSYLLAAFVVSTSVYAVPLQNRQNSSAASGSGAAYFITNDPSGNQILSMNIDSNGHLGGITATSAGGRGAHGLSDPLGPDGLFSQGSIKTNAAKKILVTVNPGSNTLSMFNINPANPAKLRMVGNPVSSEGEFPMSLAINEEGTMACVLNGGAVNGVNCYKPDSELGLIAIPNTLRSLGLNQTTPATGPAGSASHIVFSEDGQTLIASVKGVPPTPGFLAAWAITSNNSLSAEPVKSTPSAGGLLPFSMTVIPGTNAILATDAGVGFDIFNFDKSLSATSSVVPISGQGATCWSSFSSKSGNFYLTDIDRSTVTEVNVDKNLKGTIVKQYQQSVGSATIDTDIATVGENNFLYVLSPNATTVNVLNVNTAGNATTIQNFNFASAAKKAGVTLNKNNLQGMTTFIN
jgi:hypothetical protein